MPRQERIERGRVVASGKRDERDGEPMLWVDAVQLGGLDRRSENRPLVAS
jgi:hypothetical protein